MEKLPLGLGRRLQSSDGLFIALALYVALLSSASMGMLSISCALVLALALATSGYAQEFRRHLALPLTRTYLWLSLLVIFTCVVSLVAVKVYPYEVAHTQPRITWIGELSKLWYFVLPLMIPPALMMIGRERITALFRVWLLAGLGFSLIGILEVFTGWPKRQPLPLKDHEGFYHAIIFGHHLSVASILPFVFLIALDAFLRRGDQREDRVGLKRGTLALVLFVVGLTTFLTFSRTVWMALPLGAILLVIFSLPPRRSGMALLFTAAAGTVLTQIPQIRQRFSDSLGTYDRMQLWRANWHFFKLRPVTGFGFRKNSELMDAYLHEKMGNIWYLASHAHNNFLEMLAGTGILGASAWVMWNLFAFVIFFRLAQAPRRNSLGLALFMGWLVFHVNGLTQVNFWEGKVIHSVMWAVSLGMFWLLPEEKAWKSSV